MSRALRVLDGADITAGDAKDVALLRGRVLVTRALSRAAISGPDAAMEILGEVHRVAAEHNSTLLGVQAHVQAGAIHVICSNWFEALDELSHVEAHLDQLVPRERVSALLNRGLAAVSVLDLDSGRRDLERALTLAQQSGLAAQEFKVRHNLGCLAWICGDIPSALRLMDEAASMNLDITTARGLIDHGRVLLDAGLIDDAESILERALAAARRDRQPLERGDVQLDLARAALLRGELSTARAWAGQALRTFHSLHALGRAEEVELFRAAIDLGSGRHLARAAQVAATWQKDHPTGPAARLAALITAEVALAKGDVATARAALSRLDPTAPQTLGPTLHQRLLEATLAQCEGDPGRAADILSAAATHLAGDQQAVHSLEIRAGLAFHAVRIRDADVSLAATRSLPALFESVERWRASSYRAPRLRPADDPVTAELVARLRQERQRGADASGAQAIARVVELQSAITHRLRSGAGEGSAIAIAPATFDQAVAAATEHASTVVAFHEDRGLLVRLTLGPSGICRHDVGRVDEIAPLIGQVMADGRAAALARPSMGALLANARDQSLRALDAILLGGLRCSDTVVIVPTVALAVLPWRAFPSLVERPLIVSPSVTVWLRGLMTASSEPSEPSVAVIAGPGLPRAGAEVEAITGLWGRHVIPSSRRGTAAPVRSDELRSSLACATIVHLAAHGHHVEQNPLFSSVDMADGPVFAHELVAPLAAELVVLSACDVGRSRGRPGDEPLGLAAALLSLGVTCVVAATTPVRDDVADRAMRDLHAALAAGVDVATALQGTAARVPGAAAFCAYGGTWSATGAHRGHAETGL